MAENNYTPGPWKWQQFGNFYSLAAQHGMREIIISGGKTGPHFVAMMNKDGRLQPINPEHPNAKLIAAAPDLLNACQQAVDLMKKAGINHDNADVWNTLSNAIKSATI